MAYVTLCDYVNLDDENVIKSWLNGLDPKPKAKLTARLNALEHIDRGEWGKLNTEVLKGDKDGLVAIRVEYQRIQYRVLGYDGPFHGEFTLLACGTEENDRYVPLDIGQIAFNRIADINLNPGARRVRHDFG